MCVSAYAFLDLTAALMCLIQETNADWDSKATKSHTENCIICLQLSIVPCLKQCCEPIGICIRDQHILQA